MFKLRFSMFQNPCFVRKDVKIQLLLLWLITDQSEGSSKTKAGFIPHRCSPIPIRNSHSLVSLVLSFSPGLLLCGPLSLLPDSRILWKPWHPHQWDDPQQRWDPLLQLCHLCLLGRLQNLGAHDSALHSQRDMDGHSTGLYKSVPAQVEPGGTGGGPGSP